VLPPLARYVAGRLGVRVVYRDGTTVDYPAHALVDLDRPVRRILGPIYRLRADGGIAYEAPELEPVPPRGFRR
jgi:hypothetical protein